MFTALIMLLLLCGCKVRMGSSNEESAVEKSIADTVVSPARVLEGSKSQSNGENELSKNSNAAPEETISDDGENKTGLIQTERGNGDHLSKQADTYGEAEAEEKQYWENTDAAEILEGEPMPIF